jgi:hypothetical protein
MYLRVASTLGGLWYTALTSRSACR